MSNHTSGPWYAVNSPGDVCTADGTVICHMQLLAKQKDRALIAASPTLLAALHKIAANAAESPEWIRSVASEAIAKAEGRA